MQTQEDHSHPIPALNVDSLKVDLVVIQNTCSEKEIKGINSSKLVKECSLNSKTKDVHAIKYKMSKAKERCMAYFRSLHSHLQVLSKDDLKGTHIEHGFRREFMSILGQEVDTFTRTMLLNSNDNTILCLNTLDSRYNTSDIHYSTPVKCLRSPLLKEHVIKDSMKEGTDSTVQDDSSRSGNDTDADDADIRPIYDEEPMAEVGLTRQHGQILNETSNKAKIEKEIDVLETMNIELEHSVATLRKENETLKQHYKDLIQEKVFAIAALKNDLRKLKGNSVDTKFDKTSVLGKPVLPSVRNQSVVRQPNAFKSARAQMSKQRFLHQVMRYKNLSKTITQHYLPKKTESTFAKPDHMIASSSSRNSSKNMARFSSNDMVHNHYLDVAKKKIQERDRNSTTRNSTTSVPTNDSKPNPRSNNQTSRSLPVSKSSRVTITAVPKADHSKSSSSFSDSKNFEVNSRVKTQSNKTTNSNKPVDQKSHTQKPGRIFKSVGLRWIPTGKLFDSCTSKVDSEPPHGSNVDIPHIHECKQTLDVSAGTSINVQKEQSLDLSAEVHQAAETVTTSNELDLLFGPLFDEYFNGENQVVLMSSAVTTTDASNKRQQQLDYTSSTSTLATTVTANGNFDL
ncbi:hypothetical protein Tco_1541115 [Tanacetum coccineum]